MRYRHFDLRKILVVEGLESRLLKSIQGCRFQIWGRQSKHYIILRDGSRRERKVKKQ